MSAPTASRHHSDWLSLVEISGPFVSLPVLLRVFSQGLEPRDPTQAKALRAAYEEWQDNPSAPGKQRAWVLHVLTTVLGYPSNQVVEGQALPAGLEASMPEMGETLRPDFALTGPAGTDTSGKVQLLISSYTAEQKLDRPVIGKHWKATPATRMMELLHGAGVPLGLVTNGEQWMLVYAPRGEITGYASWFGALWLDEPITLRAFHSLLGVRRFFGVADDSTLLALLKESANDQQEVTDQLGFQVREAVEVLVQSFDAIDKDSNRVLLKGVSPTAQYEAALTIMMRLVFLFSAEERGLLHLGKPLYDNNYAVSTLQEQLQEVADLYGEEVLERRTDAWARLLSSFRAVHGGVKHQDLLMQAYGGSLFDPDRYPFLEGRVAGTLWRQIPAEPLGVNNRVVLHLLNSLQRLRIKSSAGAMAETRRISFRALGVEQIGHVYEGLLDHTGVLAEETVLGIKGPRNKEVEISLSKLESLLAQGQDKLVEFLKDATGRSLSSIRKSLDDRSLLDEHKLLVACGYDQALHSRLSLFAPLIREDSFERPLVVMTGSVYVTAGTDRRSSGTHYTPPSLTEPIVQHTLEPLVYVGSTEGFLREQWKLKSPKEILELKVCDMAMGSGAFLVQACRYLADRLVESWENAEKAHPGQLLITPDGKFSEGESSERLVPAEDAERIAIARRVVAERCLYGVDINPMAVEMAKLSMWLMTVDANRPFTFLDHAFKCGDSLLGITSLEQLERFSLRNSVGKQQGFATLNLWRYIDEAKKKRETLEAMPSDTPEQIAAKSELYEEAKVAVVRLNLLADCLVAFELQTSTASTYEQLREDEASRILSLCEQHNETELNNQELSQYATKLLNGQRTFHWSIEFPEVFFKSGFDAIVCNPPFLGGQRISEVSGVPYNKLLVSLTSLSNRKTDLCCYFLRRIPSLIHDQGTYGLIATNSIAQGLNQRVALDYLCSNGHVLYRANSSFKWPGVGAVEVAVVHAIKGYWTGEKFLDEVVVESITASLTEGESKAFEPLLQNRGYCYVGPFVYGPGFILTNELANEMVKASPRNADVLRPYLVGDDINSDPSHAPSRTVVYFEERNEEEAKSYLLPYQYLLENVQPFRMNTNPPKRDLRMKTQWWKFFHPRLELMKALRNSDFVCARSRVSTYHAVAVIPSTAIPSEAVVVFLGPVMSMFPVLQSCFHDSWVWMTASSLGGLNNTRYIGRDCFGAFPFPKGALIGELNTAAVDAGRMYLDERAKVLIAHQIGLTKLYKRFNHLDEKAEDILRLRILRKKMDEAVALSYGWQDLNLGHDFHQIKQGARFTISETARREVLDRLLALNHLRQSEEETAKTAASVSTFTKRGLKPNENSGQIKFDM